MKIYTTEKNEGITIEDARAALTPGPVTTTLAAAVSSGTALDVNSIVGFQDGCSVRVSPGLGAEEDFAVRSITGGTDLLNTFVAINNSHLIGATVDLLEFIPDESPEADGFSRNKLVNGHLHQDYTLSAQVGGLTYMIDSGVTNPLVDEIAIFIKNFRSAPYSGSTAQFLAHNHSATSGFFLGFSTSVIDVNTFGNGYALALSALPGVMTARYILAGLNGFHQNEPVEFAQMWLLNEHQLSSTWENEQTRQIITGSSIHRHRSGIIDVASHSAEPRQRIVGLFKNISTAEVDALFAILRLSRGPFRPIIVDPLETRAPDELILARFAHDNALKEKRIDFDLWNLTMELETLQLPDDL